MLLYMGSDHALVQWFQTACWLPDIDNDIGIAASILTVRKKGVDSQPVGPPQLLLDILMEGNHIFYKGFESQTA